MTRFAAPTRDQLSRIVGTDLKLLRAFEQLFLSAGQTNNDQLDAIEDQLIEHTLRLDAIDASISNMVSRIDDNEISIKSNEVLLWLSM